MTNQDQLNAYVTSLYAAEDDVLRSVQAEAQKQGLPTISVQPFEGRLLQILAWSIGARKMVEIGTLAGYSGIWLARALPSDGKLYTIEVSSNHAQVARASFERAGLSGKINLLEGEALPLLDKLAAQAPFDLVFIDADKANVQNYFKWAVNNLRLGGLVLVHNAFRGGNILAPQDDNDWKMDAFNRLLAIDPRLESTIIGVGDGLAIGYKRREI